MSAIDWNHLDRLIAAMTPSDVEELRNRLRALVPGHQNGDVAAQRRALERLWARLDEITARERDRYPNRGFTDRDHDAIIYDEEQR